MPIRKSAKFQSSVSSASALIPSERRQRHSTLSNIADLDQIIDIFADVYANDKKIVYISNCDLITKKIDKEFEVLFDTYTQTPSNKADLIFSINCDEDVVRIAREKNIMVVCLYKQTNYRNTLVLPLFSEYISLNVKINLSRLIIAFSRIQSSIVKTDEMIMKNLSISLRESNDRAAKSIDKALAEIQDTKTFLAELNQ